MPNRCGDLAGFSFKVTSELVGKYATTMVVRKKKFDFAAVYTEKLRKEETKKVKWPDQEVAGQKDVFYGGRKFDHKGLDKLSYDEKFKHQEFELKIYQGKNLKKSTGLPLKITPYADKGPEDMPVRSMEREYWEPFQFKHPATGKVTVLYKLRKTAAAGSLDKKFESAFKDGVFVLKISLNLIDPAKPDTSQVFQYIKKRVEAFWNSEACGFNQWVNHRTGCLRGKKCNCSVIRDSKGNYKQAGCCKVPFKVDLVESNSVDAWKVNIHYLNPVQIEEMARHLVGLNKRGATKLAVGVNTRDFYYPENRTNTYAHEIGHLMGFPDQYIGSGKTLGSVAKGAMWELGPVTDATWPISETSIMGTWQVLAEFCHVNAPWFRAWINDKIDTMEPIERVK